MYLHFVHAGGMLLSLRCSEHMQSIYVRLTVTAHQLASVAQLVRALHRNRMAVGSIPTRGPSAAFFTVVPGQILKYIRYSGVTAPCCPGPGRILYELIN